MQTTALLTFESWVTKWPWYDYARRHPEHVPYLLIDRALCEEPFLDAFAPSPSERRPVISGICRGRKNFNIGDRFIYRTKIDPRVASHLGLHHPPPVYFAVAALRVVEPYDSHEIASRRFSPRRYVTAPKPTPYPPNLVHAAEPVAAVLRESCIVFRARTPNSSDIALGQREPLTPFESVEQDRINTYAGYRDRMRTKALRAARCQVEIVNGREALALNPANAPVLTSADCERECGNGRNISETCAADLRRRIAAAGSCSNS